MRIALLGGNSYSYANAPSYVHANGRGYIRQSDLLGATAREIDYTPEMAYEDARTLRSQGKPVPANIQAMADEYAKNRRWDIAEKGMTIVESGIELGKKLFGGESKPAATSDMTQRSGDNTALIIIGGVAGVAVLATVLSSKKPRRRRA